jgi:hypothetical protein
MTNDRPQERHSGQSTPTYAPIIFAPPSPGCESDDSDATEKEPDDDDMWQVAKTPTAYKAAHAARRYSNKWVREKGGQRWVDSNYDDILQSLREL